MKTLILLVVVTLSFGASKKGQDEVKPQGTAAEVIGTYELSSFRYQTGDDDLNIPTMPVVQQGKQTYFGTVELAEAADPNQANMVLKLTLNNQAIDDIDFETVDVEKSGSKYNLLSDGSKVATISGNTLSFDVKGDDFRMAFTAKR